MTNSSCPDVKTLRIAFCNILDDLYFCCESDLVLVVGGDIENF